MNSRDQHIAHLERTLAFSARHTRFCSSCVQRENVLRDTLTVLYLERDLAAEGVSR